MARKIVLLFAIASSVLMVAAVQAHHGANLYDMTKPVVLKATITKFEWGNPHNQIFFDVFDDKGTTIHWTTSTEPPAVMSEKGWTRKSLTPGDKVIVCVFPAKNGAPVGNLEKVVFADGRSLNGGLGSTPSDKCGSP